MTDESTLKALKNIRLLTTALNIPGPVAAARLRQLGAVVTKLEPPAGDPLAQACPGWYRALTQGQEIIRMDLKSAHGRERLHRLLDDCELLLTAHRPATLARMGLNWPALHERHPMLSQVAIVGVAGKDADTPGHDLTYQAGLGLLQPPALPRTLLADLAGAERAVSSALALLLSRERGGPAGYQQVSLAQAAAIYAEPLAYGLTAPGGLLGGGLAGYNLYPAQEGWIALAALEPHFRKNLERELGLTDATREDLQRLFRRRTAGQWEAWARANDIPLAAVREAPLSKK